MKKLIAALAAVAIGASFVSMPVSAAGIELMDDIKDIKTSSETSGYCGYDATWDYSKWTGTLRIEGTGEMIDYSSDDPAPWHGYEISSVTIDDGILNIGNRAFLGCSGLKSITIPDSVTKIGNSAFFSCAALKHIKLPSKITSIGSNAFSDCTNLSSLFIPDSVTNIGGGAFALCTSLSSINIPDGVTTIGNETFSNCDSLTEISIPGSVTIIGRDAFFDCDKLSYVKIADGVSSIWPNAFYDCVNLRFITLPNSITDIGWRSFYGTPWLDTQFDENSLAIFNGILFASRNSGEVIIPDNVTRIGDGAFKYSGLSSVIIPVTVKSIGTDAFCQCSYLDSVTIENPNCEISDSGSTISNGYTNASDYYYNGIIYGYENSTAQIYSEKYDYDFESLGTAPDIETPTEPNTQPDTESPTENVTESVTEFTTESTTESSTEKATESITEEYTEGLTESDNYDSIKWNMSSGEVSQGGKINIEASVSADNNGYLPIAGARFYVPQYDGLKLVDVSGSESYNSTVSYNLNLGMVNFSTYDGLGVSAENGSIAFTLTYETDENCQPGDYTIDLSDILIIDEYGNDISDYLQVNEGIIRVIPSATETTEQYTEQTTDETVQNPGPQGDDSFLFPDGTVFSSDEIKNSEIKPQLSVSKVEVNEKEAPNKKVEISIIVNDADQLWCSSGIHLFFDPRLIPPATNEEGEILDCTYGSATYEFPLQHSHLDNYEINYTSSSMSDNGGEGIIVTYKFTLPEDAKAGDMYPIYIKYEPGDIFTNMENDKTMTAYAFTNAQAGGITVVDSEVQTTTSTTAFTTETETTTKMTTTIIKTTDISQETTTTVTELVTTATDEVTTETTPSDTTEERTTTAPKATTTKAPVATTVPSTTTPEPDVQDLGDVDRSGNIDSSDASIVLQEYALLATGHSGDLTPAQTSSADVNADGSVDSSDASTILRYYAYTATGGKEPFDVFLKS